MDNEIIIAQTEGVLGGYSYYHEGNLAGTILASYLPSHYPSTQVGSHTGIRDLDPTFQRMEDNVDWARLEGDSSRLSLTRVYCLHIVQS